MAVRDAMARRGSGVLGFVVHFQPDAFPDGLAHAFSDSDAYDGAAQCVADDSAITKPFCGSDGRAVHCSALGRFHAEVRAAIRMVC